ncbi:metallophosphoesterase [Rhizobium sp. Root1220]|uniref:metallophosphoesterase n=1 Tax=Rhizobium sp. Root1220 TaxID=1736432 RepID=UPI0006F4AEFD|nr:metallophosphoesterase [Rhizobium sp. Root1220]KQV82065.1 hypothetical protein ASC90_23390 [Rhizobium sp. Root1220]
MPDGVSSDIYAIADIHGRADLLEALLGHIEVASQESASKPIVVFLGDLVDRGPHSPRVLDLVAATLERYPGSRLVLGNHDFYLRALLRGDLESQDATNWMDWGGVATVTAYSKVPLPNLTEIAADIRIAYPKHHELLEGALTYLEIGRFCFVHAGIRPGISLATQTDYDLRWIRAGFLDHFDAFDHIVVHGHTITNSLLPEVYDNRIALDTAAYRTGRLSAAVIKQDSLSHFVYTRVSETSDIDIERWQPWHSAPKPIYVGCDG